MAQYEDVGLRARIDGVAGYTRDAQRIQAETKRIEQSMTETAKGVNQQAKSLISSLAPIGAAIAGAFAAKLGVDMFRNAVMGASDLNETLSKSQVIFGEASKDVEQFASNAAQSLGITKNAAIGTAATFGNLFKGAGVSNKASAEMSTNLVQLAADLASFNNLDPTEVLEKLRSGLVGEAEPLRSLGVLIDEETTKQYAFAKGIAKPGAELSQQQKMLARYQIILGQTGTAQGDFARTSTGVANSMRIIKASLEEASTTLGNELLPRVQPLVAAFARAIPDAVNSAMPVLMGIGDAVEAAIKGISGAFNIGRTIADAFGRGDAQTAFALIRESFTTWITPAVADMVRQLRQVPTAIIAFIQEQGPGVAAGFADWATRAGQWALDALPILTANLQKLAGAVTTWAGQQVTNLANSLIPWTQSFGKNIDQWWAVGKPKLDTLKQNIIQWINGTGIAIDAGTASWAQKFTAWVDVANRDLMPKLDKIKRDIDQASLEIVAALGKRLGEGAADAAGKLAAGLGEGIRGGKGQVEAASVELLASILFPFAAIAVKGSQIGAEFAKGIVSGLTGGLPTTLEGLTGGRGIFAPRPPALPSDFVGPVLPPPTLAPEATGMTGPPDFTADRQYGPTIPPFQIDMSQLTGAPTGVPGESIEELITQIERIPPVTTAAANSAGAALGSGLGGGAKKAADAAKVALQDAEYAIDDFIKALEGSLRELSAQIKVVDAQIKGMARIRFTGMDEAEDELYQLELAAKKAQLSVLQEETGQDTAKKIKESAKDLGAAFDVLSAQQREVREGIPVALQRWQWEQEQAKRRAEEAARKAAEPAKKETGKHEKTAAEKQLEALQKAAQIKQLEIDIEYGPKMRQWEKMYKQATGGELPVFGSPEEAMASLQPLLDKWTSLTEEEQATQVQLLEAKGLKEEIQRLQREEKIGMEDVETIQGRVNELINGRITAEEAVTTELGEQLELMRQAEAIAQKAWGDDNIGPPSAPAGDEFPGMATGGRTLTGGSATVGERGPERVVLPAGAAVLPAGTGAANVSRSFSDTWNISGGGNPQDIANQLQRMLLMRRMTQGRDDW